MASALLVDGKIDGYLGEPVPLGKAMVRIAVWQDRMFVHVEAKGAGWVAVAFNKAGKGMDGSNMLLGYLDQDGKAQARNDVGRGWSHTVAKVQGAIDVAFVKGQDAVSFEFSYPLAFAEGYALKGIEKSVAFSLILAVNERSFTLNSKHSWAAKADFVLR